MAGVAASARRACIRGPILATFQKGNRKSVTTLSWAMAGRMAISSKHSGSTGAGAPIGTERWLSRSRRALREPRIELAGIQPARARPGARHDESVARRLKFLCIVSFESRRVLRGARGRPQAAAPACAPSSPGRTPLARRHTREDRRAGAPDGRRAQYRCWNEDIRPALAKENIISINTQTCRRTSARSSRSTSRARSIPCSRRSPSTPRIRSRSSRTRGSTSSSSCRIPRTPTSWSCRCRACCRAHPLLEGEGRRALHLPRRPRAPTMPRRSSATRRPPARNLFRITRNSNLYYDEDESHNLLQSIEEELRNANRGAAVRLEVNEDCPEHLVGRLRESSPRPRRTSIAAPAPLNLVRLMPLCFAIDRPDCATPASSRASPSRTARTRASSPDSPRRHPCCTIPTRASRPSSISSRAAEDRTSSRSSRRSYRTSSDSPLVHALIQAARNGKQVTAIIELKARFDEAANIHWARLMQEAGVDVSMASPGSRRTRRRCSSSAAEATSSAAMRTSARGNYHPKTATIYTDLGIMTCNEEITTDIAEAFNLVTGIPHFKSMRHLLMAPFNMLERFLEMIDREIAHARRPASPPASRRK